MAHSESPLSSTTTSNIGNAFNRQLSVILGKYKNHMEIFDCLSTKLAYKTFLFRM